MVWILVGILVIIALLIGIKLKPFQDKAGNVIPVSISENTTIEINGLQQRIMIM